MRKKQIELKHSKDDTSEGVAVSTRSKKQPKLKYSKEDIFEVAVVSTMSSGKSTFINALIGNDLLPARNQACTARTLSVLDNDAAESVTGHILFQNGVYEQVVNCSAKQIAECLNRQDGTLADIIVECSIPGVRNIQKVLMITDTPGTNNSGDETHEAITKEYLKSLSSGLILYVMNAAQIGTDDDFALLTAVKGVLSKKPKLEILFVLNKADEIDEEKEPLKQVVENALAYLKGIGFSDIHIFLTSALSALLFKKVLTGAMMTKKEIVDFSKLIEQFSSSGEWLPMYTVSSNDSQRDAAYKVGKKEYAREQLLLALENTGMSTIERAIETSLVRQFIKKPPRVSGPDKERLLAEKKSHSKKTPEVTPKLQKGPAPKATALAPAPKSPPMREERKQKVGKKK